MQNTSELKYGPQQPAQQSVPQGQCKLDLAPRMHIAADLNKEKLNLHLSHPITIP